MIKKNKRPYFKRDRVPRKYVGAYISEELSSALYAYCRDKNSNISTVLTAAIEKYIKVYLRKKEAK